MRRIITFTIICFAVGVAVLAYFVVRDSAAAAPAPQIILFSGENFTGSSVTITDTIFDMPVFKDEKSGELNWNDETRSIIVVSGTWRLYQHGRCNTKLDETDLASFDIKTKEVAGGWSCLLSAISTGPLEIPNPAIGGFWRDISSIELVSTENLPDWAFDLRK